MTAHPSPRQLWVLRPADVCDVGAIVSLWVSEWSGGQFSLQFASRRDYEAAAKPLIIDILQRPDTQVVLAVDAEYPDSIWGLAVFRGDDGVFMSFVKRNFRKTGEGLPVMRAMLGDRLTRRQYYAHDIEGLKRCGVEPKAGAWLFNPAMLGEDAWSVKR